MKRISAVLFIIVSVLCFASCDDSFQPKDNLDDKTLNLVIPPDSVNVKYTGRLGWYSFDRNGKSYLLYYRYTANGGDTCMIIENTVSDASINNPDNHQFNDIITYNEYTVYFNESTFRTECIKSESKKGSYFIRSYIQYKINSTDDVVHLETYDTTELKAIYSYSKENVMNILIKSWKTRS